ncbi:MAG TPA: transketolase C-terminal domain-containing protein [Solirubrobacterales bacterium]|nr:transketolase C-terminal domain-containing protein [Solirubrobacterales bacterium]
MRNAFLDELVTLAETDERIMLLTGDLGFMVLEEFQQRFPDRFVNCGVGEQNMVGVATGLAEAGFVPFVYSIATFATLRPYEFIRNGPALHDLPVRVVGVGGGFDYGHNGVTHFALEDYAVMRTQPSIATIAPADAAQARAALRATTDLPGPVYFRISKRGDELPGLDGRFELGRLDVVREGQDVAILAIGSIAHEAVAAADLLAERGIDAAVGLVPSFNPSPIEDIAALLSRIPAALTVESHYRDGGLGSLVAETIAERGLDCRLLRAGVPHMPGGESGSQQFLEHRHGLSARHLAHQLEQALSPIA